MKKPFFLLIIFIFVELTNISCVAQQPENDAVISLTNVNVIPMDSERVLKNQTIVIENGRITDMGLAAEMSVPGHSKVISARGKFLMPGLADMHVHIWNKEDLLLYVANGITTVRNMNGRPDHLKWREEIADLILLNANPLADVSNVKDRAGVFLRGRWFPEKTLQKMLEKQAATYPISH